MFILKRITFLLGTSKERLFNTFVDRKHTLAKEKLLTLFECTFDDKIRFIAKKIFLIKNISDQIQY